MEQRPAIFKLNLDCFDRVFDYLALEELRQFSQTCKAMKRAVGEYYQANYGTIVENAELGEENLYLEDLAMGYSDFVQRLRIRPDFGYIEDFVKRDLSKQVMELEIETEVEWTKAQLRRLEYIINNAEVLNINCKSNGMSQNLINETVPGMCNSLKRLHMRHFNCDYAAQTQDGNKWLLHEYPTLKHLEWIQSEGYSYKINEIKEFFERNPHVRSFAADLGCLWKSHHLIIESGVKLYDLTIKVNQRAYEDDSQMIKDLCVLSNELYEKGVYKRLHLEFWRGKCIQQTIDQIIPINAVRGISLPRLNVNLSKLVNLVELHIMDFKLRAALDVDVMASQLVNLERVHLCWVYLQEMLSFIYHLVKLKKLRVCVFRDENVSALDLANMNKRREQLLDATKVTIFTNEGVYLATKWASTLTDFRLIEIRRSTAHKWGHHFGKDWSH